MRYQSKQYVLLTLWRTCHFNHHARVTLLYIIFLSLSRSVIPVFTLYVDSFVRPLRVVGCTRSNNDGNMLYFFVVPPSIDKGPTNKTVNESSDLELFCNATGNPPPNITWSKVAVPPVQLSFDEVLTVKNTNKTDSGVYQCRASNGIGSDAFASSVVTVRCKLKKFNDFFSWFIADIAIYITIPQLETIGHLEEFELCLFLQRKQHLLWELEIFLFPENVKTSEKNS